MKRPILALSLLLLLLIGCGAGKKAIVKTSFYFDTIVQITLYDTSAEPLIEECFQMASSYERLLSRTVEGSDVSRINQAQGRPVTVSEETIALLSLGRRYHELSGGAFDPVLGSLIELWDISGRSKGNPDSGGNTGSNGNTGSGGNTDPNNPNGNTDSDNLNGDTGSVSGSFPPSPAEVQDALSHAGDDLLDIDGNQVTLKDPKASVDLGGIAKGYIADRMKEYLNSQGVTEGILNLGGNVLTLGPKSDGSPYVIGIQKPFSQEGDLLLSVEITDGTVVSSGVYERYVRDGDKIYHHILSPKDGYPYDNGLYSVTILCGSSADADALSTACFGLGLEEGLALAERLPDTEAIFITDTYEIVTTSGMGSQIPYTVYKYY